MPKKLIKESALNLLRGIEPERCFWVNHGPILCNLEALEGALKDIDDDKYKYHVNKDKNDLSTWVSEVVGDGTLGRQIGSTKTRKTALKKVKDRVAFLKKVAK
ncbi:MAG: hypothetical protein U9O94_03370 [Nanoarchaeota archaeon]|nr:hypothetical protein [Nanoarchaeota archaeon]